MYTNVRLAIKTHFYRLLKMPIFHQYSAGTKDITGTLSTSFEKVLKCGAGSRFFKSQSAGGKMLT